MNLPWLLKTFLAHVDLSSAQQDEMQKELARKVKGLYKFDCLRANKSTSAWGVEARVPFLDKEFLDYAMSNIDPADKMCGVNGGGRCEKWILRKAFEVREWHFDRLSLFRSYDFCLARNESVIRHMT